MLEVLAPLTVVCAVSVWSKRKWLSRILIVVAILPMAIYSVLLPANDQSFGPRVPWTDSTFDIRFPFADLEEAMVLVHGGSAVSFLIPSAPTSTRFVRVDSNLFYVGFTSLAERYDNAMGRKITAAIKNHEGLFFSLLTPEEKAYADSELVLFRLQRQDETCRPIHSKGGPALILCRVQRVNPPIIN